MPVVEFTIGHKQYELSAQEGEERLLKRAAAMLDTEARTILEQARRSSSVEVPVIPPRVAEAMAELAARAESLADKAEESLAP